MPQDETEYPAIALRCGVQTLVFLIGTLFVADVVAGSNAAVGLQNATREQVSVPQWLYLLTGGALVGASGLLASIVTDRMFIRAVHAWHRVLPTRESLRIWTVRTGRLVGVVVLLLTIYRGFIGPQIPTVNFAIIITFAGVRAGLTTVSYLIGNPWPLVNPWRTLVELVPINRFCPYPDQWSVWPATVGLLALVFVETVIPVTTIPQVLALTIASYTLYTIICGVIFGADEWFRFGDPLAVTFRFYGSVAPLQKTDHGIELRLPGAVLAETDELDAASVAFIIALIWELTFSGFVTTQLGSGFIGSLSVFVPRIVVLVVLFISGYGLFYGAYWLAARIARRQVETYLTPRSIGEWMALPLLAIAAGYHLAHYFWLFVANSPMIIQALTNPLSPPANPIVFTLPAWSNGLNVAFILFGHLLAVWIAHARAYRLFPSRLQAIRSQYPFIIIMIGYTVTSLWLISLTSI